MKKMGDTKETSLDHLSVEKLSAILEPMIQKAVTNSFTQVQAEVSTHTSQIAELQKENKQLDQLVAEQARAIEIQKRQRNLIILGIEPSQNEDHLSLQNTLLNFFQQSLGITVEISDVDFVRRIGRRNRQSSRPPPILLGLTSLRMKLDILSNCHKLKGSDYSISNDYSPDVLKARQANYPLVKKLKEAGAKAQLREATIFIDKKPYSNIKAEGLLSSLSQ